MFINDLGMTGGGCRAVNAIRWHTANHGSAQREAGRQRTRRLVDIHINAKISLCSAAMSPSWSPDRAAWSLRTCSFIFIPEHPLRSKLSGDVSEDVRRCPQNVSGCLLMYREGKVWKSTDEISTLDVESKVKFGASEETKKVWLNSWTLNSSFTFTDSNPWSF